MAKVSCFVPVRNKDFFVDQTIKSVFAQTYAGLEIILSDQGSTDNSLAVLRKLAASYTGPNVVRVLECPDTEPTGLAGFNAHIDWLMGQTDAELIIIVSADDLCHPDRVRRTAEVYNEFRPAFIGTKMQFLKPNGEIEGVSAFAVQNLAPGESRFITAREHIEKLVGGSSSTAFDRAFYEKVGGLHGHTILDVYLPFLATLDRGFYFINEELFAYVRHPKADNAGLGGQLLAAAGNDDETLLLNELANYQCVSTLYQAGRVAVNVYPKEWAMTDACEALYNNIVNRANDWTNCRDLLNQRKIQPRVL